MITIERPGQLLTVQDLGRPHLRRVGVPTGGAVDAVALRTANLLAGNAEDAAGLECALVGPVLRFDVDTTIAISGARVAGVPYCEPFVAEAGRRISLERFDRGAYTYVAVAGGIDVPLILGGRGTDLRLKFGGHHGRPLRAGDVLRCGQTRSVAATVRVGVVGTRDADDAIRVVDGKDAGLVPPDWIEAAFVVSSKSDRVGVRLGGSTIVAKPRADTTSGVVLPGTIQLPGDGVPIVLLADAQTLGGYPQIAHVIGPDLPRLAQRRPNESVRFRRVSLDEAHRVARRYDRELNLLRQGIRLSRPPWR